MNEDYGKEEAKCIDELHLLDICNNFLIFDQQLYYWRFAHLSVAEYLEAQDNFAPELLHATVVTISLHHLKMSDEDLNRIFFPETILSSDVTVQNKDEKKVRDVSGLWYLLEFWPLHLRAYEEIIRRDRSKKDPTLVNLLKDFLGSPTRSSDEYKRWFQAPWALVALRFRHGADTINIRRHVGPSNRVVKLMCWAPLYTVLSDWWEPCETFLEKESKDELLFLASIGGCKESLQLSLRMWCFSKL